MKLMKKRDIIIDLTAFVDVILILMFLVLTQNTGDMFIYRDRLAEVEAHMYNMEGELQAADAALADAANRLEIFSDWDDALDRMKEEIDALTEWQSVVAEAAHFVFIRMNIVGDHRVINITSSDNFFSIMVLWAEDGRNVILNTDEISNDLNVALQRIVGAKTGDYPIFIMFSYNDRVARQEHSIIVNGVRTFIDGQAPGLRIYPSVHRGN